MRALTLTSNHHRHGNLVDQRPYTINVCRRIWSMVAFMVARQTLFEASYETMSEDGLTAT
jgi:hypothetical protein